MENEQNLIKLLEALSTSYPERISLLVKYIYQILNDQNLNNLDKNIIIYNYLERINNLASNIASSSKKELGYLLRDISNKNNNNNKNNTLNEEPER